MSDELKPCAHCGESAELMCPSGLSWWVQCTNKSCGMATKIVYSPDPAVAIWNRRQGASIAKQEVVAVLDDVAIARLIGQLRKEKDDAESRAYIHFQREEEQGRMYEELRHAIGIPDGTPHEEAIKIAALLAASQQAKEG